MGNVNKENKPVDSLQALIFASEAYRQLPLFIKIFVSKEYFTERLIKRMKSKKQKELSNG